MLSHMGALSVWLGVAKQAADDAEDPKLHFGGNGRRHNQAARLASVQKDAIAFLGEVRSHLGDQRAVTAYDVAEAVDTAVRLRGV